MKKMSWWVRSTSTEVDVHAVYKRERRLKKALDLIRSSLVGFLWFLTIGISIALGMRLVDDFLGVNAVRDINIEHWHRADCEDDGQLKVPR